MTQRQRIHLYFPAWRSAFAANWSNQRGQVSLLESPANAELARKIDTLAKQRAADEFRAPSGDDLRHMTHLLVLGRPVSSNDLGNRDLDRVLNTFRLLANPDNLQAVMEEQAPDAADRKRMEYAVRNCGWPEAYVLHVCREKFGTSRWDSLPLARLHQLVITLKARRRARLGSTSAAPFPGAPPIARPNATPRRSRIPSPPAERFVQTWSVPSTGAFGATYTGD